ncbi:short-chain dehydrogenase/reductase [Mycobacterium spongiae]|uniref:SDR family NAD(P)-dependent oxidoreductase n=1 Tax=Mycobacterium spongiae TaxID=886343 RepID=A0A975PX13_9MYCO|nr:short-chain dehydrogenase/reductase [Mycobacterium spongiae]QUR67735.1 SDR family NAD(P)-dependent oxidoreductase [Mycobacterium spongiae]
MDLTGKRVLITGGGRGIGAVTARKLAEAGSRVALLDIEQDRVAQTAAELGPGHLGLAADVTDSASLDTAVQAAVQAFGGLDVVVANAGVASWQTVPATDVDAWARTVEVNLTGVFRTVRATIPHVIASKGYVLVVSSLASIVPMPGGSAYGASKSGVEGFANALRLEMHPHEVAVGSAHPTVITTDLVGDLTTSSSALKTLVRVIRRAGGARTADECAALFVRGIRMRARRVYVPRWAVLLQWLRPLLYSTACDRLIATTGRSRLRRGMAIIDGLPASAPERVLAQTTPRAVPPTAWPKPAR